MTWETQEQMRTFLRGVYNDDKATSLTQNTYLHARNEYLLREPIPDLQMILYIAKLEGSPEDLQEFRNAQYEGFYGAVFELLRRKSPRESELHHFLSL